MTRRWCQSAAKKNILVGAWIPVSECLGFLPTTVLEVVLGSIAMTTVLLSKTMELYRLLDVEGQEGSIHYCCLELSEGGV